MVPATSLLLAVLLSRGLAEVEAVGFTAFRSVHVADHAWTKTSSPPHKEAYGRCDLRGKRSLSWRLWPRDLIQLSE